MNKKIKCSFDFDQTLFLDKVQKYAKELISKGEVEVHITTMRYGPLSKGNPNDPYWTNVGDNNWKHVWALADNLRISRDNIHFCDMQDKTIFFKDKTDFIWHLDDDINQVKLLRAKTNVAPILCQPYRAWQWQCNNYIEEALHQQKSVV